ncbi:hypothetical protein [Burkholderia stagnalis]|uniref:Uncharacterized protein n=1 Tax=Burkholderia stagnalis TaxID=1503054 RepID=A0ABX9YW65_9BURK|nr:hypothetical protein [Burkholderia stagnalis]KVN59036.1 hypothetical protein WT14_21895 [Burkholderia stagnalis]RQQ35746.1 hypothetical protein DF163_03580 [Burkholderia stagnalis]RQQ39405.1 hypothetical protein DF149_00385 [Burkholderia stagnalis]RQQ54818.1 hypothetical protein DF162_03700 [Burkholderia stagnalis]RQQ56089.1 hypothetical protein DF145_01140 [Burkholderia stagnalis]
MAPQKQTPSVHYELNVCGGRFETVKERFQAWKREPLIARPGRLMFEGKTEVRRLDARCFGDTEAARRALQDACRPQDDFALAAPAREDGRQLWLVLAAYDA